MAKAITNVSGNWVILDSVRDGGANPTDFGLYANTTHSENNGSLLVDFLSNGFKIRHQSSNMNNSSSDTYVYAAFAEAPF
jgi:hypothetical protein